MYITDAAREYAKNHVKDDKLDLYFNMFDELAKVIDDFDKKYGEKLWAILHSEEFDEDELDQSGPTIGGRLTYAYMKNLKQSDKPDAGVII